MGAERELVEPAAIDGYQAARRIESEWSRARNAEIERLERLKPTHYRFQEVRLERVQFGASILFSLEFFQRAKMDAEYEAARQLVRCSVRGLIPAMGGDKLIFPKTWKDHLKRDMPRRLRRFCEWLLRRPLRIERETYEVTRFVAGLPELKGDHLTFIDTFRERSEP